MPSPSDGEPALLKAVLAAKLFSGLSEAEALHVLKSSRKRHYQAGEFLFQEEDPAQLIFLLVGGQVKLYQLTPDGQQVTLRYAISGEAVGAIAILSHSTYPVTAESVEESDLLSWDQGSFRQIMEKIPVVALNSLEIFANQVREFQSRIRELATEKVQRRIARALLRLAQQTGRKTPQGVLIDLPLSRQDLAEMTGTTLFTVSRTLSQWESQGIIKSGREQIVICFPHGLVSIAEDLPNPTGSQE